MTDRPQPQEGRSLERRERLITNLGLQLSAQDMRLQEVEAAVAAAEAGTPVHLVSTHDDLRRPIWRYPSQAIDLRAESGHSKPDTEETLVGSLRMSQLLSDVTGERRGSHAHRSRSASHLPEGEGAGLDSLVRSTRSVDALTQRLEEQQREIGQLTAQLHALQARSPNMQVSARGSIDTEGQKSRAQETEKKLLATEAFLHEVEQARDLYLADLTAWKNKAEHYQRAATKAEEDARKARSKLQATETALEKAEEAIRGTIAKDSVLEKLQLELARCTEERERSDECAHQMEALLQRQAARLAQNEERIVELSNLLCAKERELSLLREREQDQVQLQYNLELASTNIDISKRSADLADERRVIAEDARARLEAELSAAREELLKYEGDIRVLQVQIDELNELESQRLKQTRALMDAYKEKNAEYAQLYATTKQFEARSAELVNQVGKYEAEIAELRRASLHKDKQLVTQLEDNRQIAEDIANFSKELQEKEGSIVALEERLKAANLALSTSAALNDAHLALLVGIRTELERTYAYFSQEGSPESGEKPKPVLKRYLVDLPTSLDEHVSSLDLALGNLITLLKTKMDYIDSLDKARQAASSVPDPDDQDAVLQEIQPQIEQLEEIVTQLRDQLLDNETLIQGLSHEIQRKNSDLEDLRKSVIAKNETIKALLGRDSRISE
ncbi:hypothetical protein GMRT_23074 [Giardia muris]|uniref:Coiled-coil protein n=1 Tax=Giardia muris TaxID=5742 RepID=A0A4Z1T4N6_GIAMU|nr:hypothetical protein GMRT_23074 [Giardia muris]|eukprot:TNJ27489.1 hypothetical protein GMRT_23074 [Giardia muris]